MADLFDGYAARTASARSAAFDEMFAPDSQVRLPYRQIHAALAQLTTDELRGRTEALADSYLAQGVTFDFAGEERPFPWMLFLASSISTTGAASNAASPSGCAPLRLFSTTCTGRSGVSPTV